jgi:O-antigen ligase
MAICLYGVIASGSRVSMATVLIALFMKFGLNYRSIGIISLCAVAFIALSYSNIEIASFNRLYDTVESGDFVDSRKDVRLATLMMIEENPIIGNGLYAKNTGEAAEISEMGSHNGYLDLMKMIGIPLTIILVFYLIKDLSKIIKRYLFDYDMLKRSYFFVVVTVPLASFFEGYMWGINQLTTTLFFIVLATICYDMKIAPQKK